MKTFTRSLFLSCLLIVANVLCREIPSYNQEYANYPQAKIDKLDLSKYKFDTSPIEGSRNKRSPASSTDKNDNDNFLIEAKLCESNIVFTRPIRLKNLDDKVQTIVNHENYTQYVRFEECMEPSFPCTGGVYPFDVKSFCHQNYNKVMLLTYDEELDCLAEDEFMIPSTCDCKIDTGDLMKGVHNSILSEKQQRG